MLKRGNIITENVVGLIIALIIIIPLIFLIVNYFQPNYDVYNEYSKAQFAAIEKAMAEAEEDGEATHTIIATPENTTYYLIYFGENRRKHFGETNTRFVFSFTEIGWRVEKISLDFMTNKVSPENNACICYAHYDKIADPGKAESFSLHPHCGYCKNLATPLSIEDDMIPLIPGQAITITDNGGAYAIQ